MRIDESTFPGATEIHRECGRKLVAAVASAGDVRDRAMTAFGTAVANETATQIYGGDLAVALTDMLERIPGGKPALLAGLRTVQLYKANLQLQRTQDKYAAVCSELEAHRTRVNQTHDGAHGSYMSWPVRIFTPGEGRTVIQHLNNPKQVEIVDSGLVEELSAKRRRSSHERPA